MSNAINVQSRTEIQDLIKQFYYKENCEIDFHDFSKSFWVYLFFQNFPGLEIAVLKFHDFSKFFHDRTNPECDGRVRLSKSDKNIGAGRWIIYLKLWIRVTF